MMLIVYAFIYILIGFFLFFSLFRGYSKRWVEIWIRDHWNVAKETQFSSLILTVNQLLVVGMVVITSWLLFKGLTTLSAIIFSGNLLDMFTMIRGVFDYQDDIQNPLAINHLIGGLFVPTLAQIASVWFMITALRWTFIYIKNAIVADPRLSHFDKNLVERASNFNMDEDAVTFWGIIGVLLFSFIEMVFNVQILSNYKDIFDEKTLKQILHLVFSLLKYFSYMIIYIGIYHASLIRNQINHLKTIDKNLGLSKSERLIYTNFWVFVAALFLTTLAFNLPLYSGLHYFDAFDKHLFSYFGILLVVFFVARKFIKIDYDNLGELTKLDAARPYIKSPSLIVPKKIVKPIIWIFSFLFVALLVLHFAKLGTFILANITLTLVFFALAACIPLLFSLLLLFISQKTDRQQLLLNIKPIIKTTTILIMYPVALFFIIFNLMVFFPKKLDHEFVSKKKAAAGVAGSNSQIYANKDTKQSSDGMGIPISEIPEFTKRVMLSSMGEDQYFNAQRKPFAFSSNNYGVNLFVLRAIGTGKGGSNINNQVIKNILFNGSGPQDIARKWAEQIASFGLAVAYTPDEILNYYVNIASVTVDKTKNGWLESAEKEFGKPVGQLNLIQQIYHIKSLTSNGSIAKLKYETARKEPQRLKDSLMLKVNKLFERKIITEQEYNRIQGESIDFAPSHNRYALKAKSHNTDLFFNSQFNKQFSDSQPITAYTNYSLDNQDKVLVGVNRFKNQMGTDTTSNGHPLAYAAIVVNYKTGEVVGHYSNFKGTDYVTFGNGFPIGSTIKPFLFTQFVHEGGNPNATFYDGQRGNTPNNYSGSFSNQYVGIGFTLKTSLNAPGANIFPTRNEKIAFFRRLEGQFKLMNIKSLSEAEFADLHGIERNYPIGQPRRMTPFQLAQAYQCLFNDGKMIPLHLFSHTFNMATNKSDTLSYEPVQIWKPQATRAIKNFMRGALETKGTASGLRSLLPGRVMYAKTGTTDSYQHGWVVLATANHLLVAWVSYNPDGSSANSPAIPNNSGGKSAGYLGAFILNEMNLR